MRIGVVGIFALLGLTASALKAEEPASSPQMDMSLICSGATDVQFRIVGGNAEMNIPAYLLPELNSSRGGWLKVKNLQMSDTEIRGKVSFNFISGSTFSISRVTGLLTSNGRLQGQCRAIALTQRRF